MTKEYLKKNAIFIDEVDTYENGIYLYTDFYFLLNNILYCSTEHSNQMKYTGKNDTFVIIDDVKKAIDAYTEDYFTGYPYYMSENAYEKLKKSDSKII